MIRDHIISICRNLRSRKLVDDGGVTGFADLGSASEMIVYDCQNQANCPPNPPIMWRSSQVPGTYAWPTTDVEINKAVATTVQLTRLMRSISGGTWRTYRRTDAVLRIYLHINMQNAFYDGTGIYFGQVDG